LAPSADTVRVSPPAFTPVTWNRAWPALSVVMIGADTVLPAAEATEIGLAAITLPAESRRPTVYSLAAPATRLVGPFSVSWVPITATVTDCASDPLVAFTRMTRLDGSAIDSVALATPLTSVRALTICSRAPVSVVENSTCWLAIVRLAESLTMALMVALVRPSDPIEGTLVVSCIEAGSVALVPPLPPFWAPAPPPPQPATKAAVSSPAPRAIHRITRLEILSSFMNLVRILGVAVAGDRGLPQLSGSSRCR
jgi:hypothetical protein